MKQLALAACLMAVPAVQETALERRAEQIGALVCPEPVWPEDLFHPAFFHEITPARLRSIFVDYHATCGGFLGAALLDQGAPFSARYRLDFERDQEVLLTLMLEREPPHRVSGFFFGQPTPALADLAALDAALGALPGTTSLLAVRLAGEGPEELFARAPDARLAVGSAFKLYVLGRLVADVAAGRRAWQDTVALASARRSLPSGILQTWPLGAPVTLHTLATLMIAHSDNTATDHLMHALGRLRVEEMLGTMDHGDPGRNAPLLSTGELFRLRGAQGGRHAAAYLALESEARRAYLADVVARLPLEDVDPLALARPEDCARLEWFASTRDLCRAMDWLRRASEAGPAAPARAILAVQPGDAAARLYDYAGYKGGATGGVLNHTWLLRAADGTWLALSATWNDPAAPLDAPRFGGLVSRALSLLARGEPPASGASGASDPK